MNSPAAKPTLDFLVAVTEEELEVQGTKGLFGRGEREIVLQEISVETLRRNLRSTMVALREAFDGLERLGDGLPLKEVQISFEVTASGKISLLGTGAEVAGTGGITLTFGGN